VVVTFTANVRDRRDASVEEAQRSIGAREGVGVARALHAIGHPTVAVMPVWGAGKIAPGDPQGADPLPLRCVRVGRTIRAGRMSLAPAEIATLHRQVLASAAGAEWAVLCGDLPAGAPEEFYAALTRSLHERTGRRQRRLADRLHGAAVRTGAGRAAQQ
jgi:fructose-1-phosphate kinase PfkB-like protein